MGNGRVLNSHIKGILRHAVFIILRSSRDFIKSVYTNFALANGTHKLNLLISMFLPKSGEISKK